MNIDTLLTKCNEIVSQKKYSKHRFVIDFNQTLPHKSDLGHWALQKYHQVYLQNQIFSIIHAKSNFEDVRQFMIEQLIAEETGINCGSDSHYNLMRRFATACGIENSQFEPNTCNERVLNYVNILTSIMRHQHFVIGLITIYAIESQSGESVSKLLAVLRQKYDFSETELEWFKVHAEEDDDHADKGVRLIKKYYPLIEGHQISPLTFVNKICDAWLDLHDYYTSLILGENGEYNA